MDKRILSLKEVAQYLGKTENAPYLSVARREVPFRKWGKRLVFDRVALDQFVETLPGVRVDEALDRDRFMGRGKRR